MRVAGYHFHNADPALQAGEYVRETLIENLRNGKVELPMGDHGKMETVTMPELGILHPILIKPPQLDNQQLQDLSVLVDPASAAGAAGNMGEVGGDSRKFWVQRFVFDVQFCWQPKTPSERRAAKQAQEKGNSADIAARNALRDEKPERNHHG